MEVVAKERGKVLVIGSINMDLSMNLRKVPEAGETLGGEEYSYIPGGKGANQAVAAARMGAEVSLCGRVGDDADGEVLLNNLINNDIRTTLIKKDYQHKTGFAAISVESNGDNRIVVFAGANASISKADVGHAIAADNYDAIIMQFEIPLDTVFYAFEQARVRGIPVILDTGPATKIDLSRLEGIYIVSPNEGEASVLTGIQVTDEESAHDAAKVLSDATHAKYVVVKMGARGALLYEGGRSEIFPAFKTIPVDTTAAGDAFMGTMAVKLIQCGDVREAVRYGNAAGALTVSKKGAQPSLPTIDEITRFLEGATSLR